MLLSSYKQLVGLLGGVSLVAQMVKNLLVMQETWVQSLGQEVPLKKGKATHARILSRRIPCTEDTVHGITESDMTK